MLNAKLAMSALMQFIIAGGGASLAVLSETEAITAAGIWAAVLTGLVAAAKDVQAVLMRSPKDEAVKNRPV